MASPIRSRQARFCLLTSTVRSFATNLDGPWGLALRDDFDRAKVFVSNVLNGAVTRIDLSLPDSVTVNVTGRSPRDTNIGRTPLRSCWVRPDSFTTDVLYVASTA